jgi:tripartite-type tricarboxylate transporter receptor subunit TctC
VASSLRAKQRRPEADMSSLKGLFFIILVTILPSLALSQPSQTWPEHTVRLITSSTPGGSGDIVARLFAERLSTRWKANVIVENRPGADGMIAIQAVLGATDGQTLLLAPSSNVTVTPAIHKVPYRNEDLRPLSTAAIDFLAVVVPAASSIRSLADLIAAARERPGALNWFASSGSPAMAFGEFVRKNQLDLVYVPYKGSPEAVRDLSESRIQVSLIPLAAAFPLAQAGRLRLIAVTNPKLRRSRPTCQRHRAAAIRNWLFRAFSASSRRSRCPSSSSSRFPQTFKPSQTIPKFTTALKRSD